MARKKDETLLPERKARGDVWKKIHALPADERHAAAMKLRDDMRAHPDYAAAQRIEDFLQAAHLHSDLRGSPELSKLVFVFREIIHDFVPGETVEQALEPLQTLLARHGGGRPTSLATWQSWTVMFDALARRKPTLTKEELYEEVAADWESAGHKATTWRGIQKGILALKRIEKDAEE